MITVGSIFGRRQDIEECQKSLVGFLVYSAGSLKVPFGQRAGCLRDDGRFVRDRKYIPDYFPALKSP